MPSARQLLRPEKGHDSEKVAFVELFFDLVFVFAITQLSHTLIKNFTFEGALQTTILLLAVWWVWVFTTWVTNWLDPEKIPVRTALLVLMAIGLILSAALPEAFGKHGFAFAVAYVTMQVGRSLFFLWAVRGNSEQVRNFQRILVWLAVGGVFWITGAFFEGITRMAIWAVALAIEYASPSLGFRVPGLGKSAAEDWKISGHHIAERCGLFIIIALGESVLVTGGTFSGLDWNFPVIAAFAASLIGNLALWWLYFDTASDVGSQQISTSSAPGRLARLAYTYLHLLLVAGIIVIAAADEFVLAHPSGHSSPQTTIALLGGTALYLVGNLLFKRVIGNHYPPSHFIGLSLLAILIPFASHFAPWQLSAATTAIIILVAIWEKRSVRG